MGDDESKLLAATNGLDSRKNTIGEVQEGFEMKELAPADEVRKTIFRKYNKQ